MTTATLQLLLRDGCGLCEEAEALLRGLGLVAQEVDIGADLELEVEYALRIPVLRDAAGRELDWPFGVAEISTFVQSGTLP